MAGHVSKKGKSQGKRGERNINIGGSGAREREMGIQIQATKEGEGGISLWLIIYRPRELIKRCTRMRTRGAHIEGAIGEANDEVQCQE